MSITSITWKDRPTVVTGADGLVGSWLTRSGTLAAQSVGIANPGSTFESNITGTCNPQSQYLSACRARTELPWSPLFILDEGLTKTISWYQEFLA